MMLPELSKEENKWVMQFLEACATDKKFEQTEHPAPSLNALFIAMNHAGEAFFLCNDVFGVGEGDTKMSEKKLYNFFCRTIKWVECDQRKMTEEEVIKFAKDNDLRWEEVSQK